MKFLEFLNDFKKSHKKWYNLIVILFTGLLGTLIGFYLSNNYLHLEHTGWGGDKFGFSSFSYNNFDNFRTTYYPHMSTSAGYIATKGNHI